MSRLKPGEKVCRGCALIRLPAADPFVPTTGRSSERIRSEDNMRQAQRCRLLEQIATRIVSHQFDPPGFSVSYIVIWPGYKAPLSALLSDLLSNQKSGALDARHRVFLSRRRHDGRHGIFPTAIGERVLIGTVRLHDENLRKGLEGIVVQRRFVLESIARAGPQNVLAVRGPGRVAVVARRDGQLV